jgi:hypothetical protein
MTSSTRTTMAAWTSGSLASGATVARYRSVSWIWPLAQVDSTDRGASRAATATSSPATTGRHQPRRSPGGGGSISALRRATSSRSLSTSAGSISGRGSTGSALVMVHRASSRWQWRHPWRVTRESPSRNRLCPVSAPRRRMEARMSRAAYEIHAAVRSPRHAGGLRRSERVRSILRGPRSTRRSPTSPSCTGCSTSSVAEASSWSTSVARPSTPGRTARSHVGPCRPRL